MILTESLAVIIAYIIGAVGNSAASVRTPLGAHARWVVKALVGFNCVEASSEQNEESGELELHFQRRLRLCMIKRLGYNLLRMSIVETVNVFYM